MKEISNKISSSDFIWICLIRFKIRQQQASDQTHFMLPEFYICRSSCMDHLMFQNFFCNLQIIVLRSPIKWCSSVFIGHTHICPILSQHIHNLHQCCQMVQTNAYSNYIFDWSKSIEFAIQKLLKEIIWNKMSLKINVNDIMANMALLTVVSITVNSIILGGIWSRPSDNTDLQVSIAWSKM